jgi:hypothetical protein
MIESDFESKTTGTTTGEMTEDLRQRAEQAFQRTKDQAGAALDRGELYVRENPISFVLFALLGGFLLGMLLGPRKRNFQDRYIDEPLEKSQGAIIAASLALGALARRAFRLMQGAGQDAAATSRGFAKPISRVMKQAGRKMHMR